MRSAILALVLILTACGGHSTPSALSTPVETKLTCNSRPAPTDPLVLMIKPSTTESEAEVLNVVNPIRPVEVCNLGPASGGRFISATRIALWTGDTLRVADMASGSVAVTARLPAVPTDGKFSPDGSLFAYRVGGDTDGLSTHLFVAGHDRILVVRAGIGGHGGSTIGPTAQLKFSADGQHLLSVDSLFARFDSGPPNFLVYNTNGSIEFQSATAGFGVWATQGAKLFFLAMAQQGDIGGDVHSWEPHSNEVQVAQGLKTYFWPALGPDGRRLVFNSYDSKGLPRLWSLDLSTGLSSQLSKGISTDPQFVGHHVIWSNEEKPCDCGLGVMSEPDGKVLVHDLQTGHDTAMAVPGSPMSFITDTWLG
jgi:WD40-like Beta Propeller Repeat